MQPRALSAFAGRSAPPTRSSLIGVLALTCGGALFIERLIDRAHFGGWNQMIAHASCASSCRCRQR